MPASEIQQMLRSGKSVKTVAAAAKTELAWVERLAEPVLTERMGVVRLAQRAYMLRPRLGLAGLQLGDAVRRNLEDRRATTAIEGFDDAWDAKANASGVWRVRVSFSHRGKRRTAEWEFRKGSRQIVPRNRLATELGWWAPDVAPPPEPAEGEEPSEEGAEQGAAPRPARRRVKPRARKRGPSSAKPRRASSKKKPSKRGTRRPATRRRR
jgi:hypothetical protein